MSVARTIRSMENKVRASKMPFKQYQKETRALGWTPAKSKKELA